ncbi:MAG: sulfotransferase [Deltaproteobacteria bacterium]|nr:sulfotransferase [Deltaproteobacteria bacterium]
MQIIIRKQVRQVVLGLCFFLSPERKRNCERWLRGREEARKLRHAGAVIVSFGKSGRTWLRVMISRYYQLTHDLGERSLMGFDNFHRRNAAIPSIFFTHDNYLSAYTGNVDSKSDFYDQKIILLVRNPRDVAVSQYFQWKYRMRKAKKTLNHYPEHGKEVAPFDFAMDPECGLPKIIEFMNLWADESPRMKDLLVVRYEDMRSSPIDTFRSIVEFLGGPADDAAVRRAVEYASVENMRKLEAENAFWLSGGRMKPGKKGDPNSFKVRRAKVDGYHDYFSPEEVKKIDELVRESLSPYFGYKTGA